MRIAFVSELEKIAQKDKSVFLLTADLGFGVFENYKKKFPDRYLNVGVAEQNMTGVAAGLALEGFHPIIYSIIPFATMRNFEQIRNDICYQNLPVVVVGVGSGFSYGPYGRTHHGLEDLAIIRSLPNISIFSPSDPVETAVVTSLALKMKTPVYIRIGKAGEPKIHDGNINFKLGEIFKIKNGKNIAVLATGNIISEVLKASDILKKNGIEISIFSVPTIKPMDAGYLMGILKNYSFVFTVEEHSIIGGLGTAISEIIAENSYRLSFKRIGATDKITHFVGNQQYMRKKHGLSSDKIAEIIKVYVK